MVAVVGAVVRVVALVVGVLPVAIRVAASLVETVGASPAAVGVAATQAKNYERGCHMAPAFYIPASLFPKYSKTVQRPKR